MIGYHFWFISLLGTLAFFSCSTLHPDSPNQVGMTQTIPPRESSDGDESLQSTPPFISETPIEPLDKPTPLPSPRSSNRIVYLAVRDLADRLSISPEEIEVLSATFMERPFQESACEVSKEKITLPAYKIEMEIFLKAMNRVYQYVAAATHVYYCGMILD